MAKIVTTDTQLMRVFDTRQKTQCALHAETLNRIDERQITMFKKMEGVERVLITGNGKPSLITQVEIINTRIDNHEKDDEKKDKNNKWHIGNLITILVCLLTLMVTIGIALHVSSENKSLKEVVAKEIANFYAKP